MAKMRVTILVCSLLATVFVAGAAAQTPAANAEHWVGTWAASPMATAPPPAGRPAAPVGLDNQTMRMIVRVSIGGNELRLRFSNAYGTQPVTLGDVHVALAGAGSAILPGTDHAVTFSGQPSFTMPPGADVLSDPIPFPVPALSRLAVSIYVPYASGLPTQHALASQTNYIVGPGDEDTRTALTGATEISRWYWLSGVDALEPANSFAVIALGDSITDGAHSTRDANHRWPDYMADDLDTASGSTPALSIGVLNEGISGNRILHDESGPNALARFNRDVLSQYGVRAVLVLEGINDIGWSDEPGGRYASQAVSAADIIAGLEQIVQRAHAAGLKIIGCTLTPYMGAFYESPAGEAKREAVNAWIRTPGHFDAVIDFDKLTRDPQNPLHYLPAYDSGDHLHPGDAGYAVMGQAAANAVRAMFEH